MNRKIYISGPISGLPYEQAQAAFTEAENAIRSKYGALVDVVNPIRLAPRTTTWNNAMRACLSAMMECDTIAMLPGWENSEGARLEHTIAMKLGFAVCNEHYDIISHE